ncbi:MAG: DUF305 domain-containing protein [Gemmatimonadota bacterium]|jgi:uncharacterized protein (DUF305 family)|nr:DUF305 domain-containing protein [Gemmatimonadota bacterium]MDQ8152146.1 DUF305 domain-containing protein [Gemmatimonadota bacterium]MDQ8170842.1 DUF305 domain-containing protein [Gemmatimonadota bacterium]MDQ8174238.1 DUF305 domain-containing protein [Gemmatimonadota bacterium]MDQ8177840.1 DUF305 domain-containing protein [Gemmatimonadota bacterium]
MWTPRHHLVLLLVITAPAVLTAQGRAGHTPTTPATAVSGERPSGADIAFIRGMLAHHAQAVEMVSLVPQRTTRRDLRLIAERIDVSQRDEIVWMRDWLADHRILVAEGHGAHDHAAMGRASMPGMLSPDAMVTLARATGREFERRFLEGMITHHEGALTMVATLFGSENAAQRPEIFGFASDVDADQRAEIARLRKVLAALTAPTAP